MELSARDQQILDAAEGWHMMTNYSEAASELRQIDTKAGETYKALDLRSRVHWGLRQIPEALECASKIIELRPDSPGGYIFKAMLLSFEGKNADAFSLLISVVDKFPDHATLH